MVIRLSCFHAQPPSVPYPLSLHDALPICVYNTAVISERHRHRYEFNRAFEETLTRNGLVISGVSPDKNFVEIVEVEDQDRKSTRLNSSHSQISYAVFCLKKKKKRMG